MRIVRKICSLLYLASAIMVIGCVAGLLYAPTAPRIELAMHAPAGKVVLVACMAVLGLGVLLTVVAALTERREPRVVCPRGNQSIQITAQAIEDCARAAATEDDVLIESVSSRIAGADRAEIRLEIEAIALVLMDAQKLAERIERRVGTACEQLIGEPCVTVRVRFLPSKTTVVQGGTQ